MTIVRFDIDEDSLEFKNKKNSSVRGMAGWLIRRGLVKSTQQANLLLIGAVIIGALVTLYNLYSLTIGSATTIPTDTIDPGSLL